MQYLDLTPVEIDTKSLQKRSAKEDDCSRLITNDCIVRVDGVTKVVYLSQVRHPDIERAREAVKKIKYNTSTRTGGLVSTSRIFGFAPRNVLRGHPCRATTLASESQSQHDAICKTAPVLNEYYEKYFPEIHKNHSEMTDKVMNEWRIPDSVFTSGIVNCNNPLQYHFDAGNFSQVCSAMLGFRHKIQGGYLSCPELDAAFEISDYSVILFDGQKLLHGVTPMKKLSDESFRYTIVYYSLKQMWHCDTVTEEVAALRARRTEIERRKVAVKASHDKKQD